MEKISYCLRELYKRVGEHNLTSYSAQMAYFFLLSIFPFLILMFAILGKMQFTYDLASMAYMQLVPYEAYEIIDGYIAQLLEANLEAVLPISLVASLITASKAMNALERAFNQAYEVSQPRKYFYGRVIGVLMTTLVMAVLILGLTLPSMGKSFSDFLKEHIVLDYRFQIFFDYGRWLLMIGVFIFVLSVIYTIMPNRKLKLTSVLPGVVITMAGLIALSAGFSFFVKSFSNISFVYGSLGTVITLMLWLYFVGILLMLGAEINAVLMNWNESHK